VNPPRRRDDAKPATGAAPAAGEPVPPRRVRCPTCGGPALYSAANRWRPFCGERCRQLDLGAWASEEYRVAAEPRPADGGPEDADGGAAAH
jgi:endogenous inhibitor of DNA gyrase (YacG/DUF329 family)